MSHKELARELTDSSIVEFDQASTSFSNEVAEDSNATQHSPLASSPANPLGGKNTREYSANKVWQRLELGVLVVAILIVWGLLSLPIVFYHLPSDDDDTTGCVVYNITNGLCIEALQEIQTCITNGQSGSNITGIYVSPGDFTQEEVEDIVLIGTSLASSPECEQVLVPFLCQFLFAPCDDNGESYLPSYNECRVITTEICPTAWDLAATLIGDLLPSCDTLPQTSLSCNDSNSRYITGDSDSSGNDSISGSGNNEVQPTSNSTECAAYTGQTCKEALLGVQNCLTDRIGSDDVYIPFDANQVEIESQASLTLFGLGEIASPECKQRAIPFLCVYYFGLCDSSGVEYQSSMEECINISTGVCQSEWITANQFLPGQLPTCDSLLEGSILCAQGTLAVVDHDTDVDPDIGPNMDSQPSSSGNCTITGRPCRDAFYCESGICLPRCDEWEQYTHATVVAIDVVVILSASIGLIAAITVLVLSCINWKRVFKFPFIIIVYMTGSVLGFVPVLLITYTDRTGLFCNSKDLINSADDPTPFCVLSGVVFYYVILQLAILWLIHVAMLFWKIYFPFRAQTYAHHLVLVHIATVIIAVLGPLVPVIAALAGGGFRLVTFPPILCVAKDPDPIFYTFDVPIIILMQIGFNVLALWLIQIKAIQGSHQDWNS